MKDTNSKSSNEIKAEAISLGFFACGIAQAERVDDEAAKHFDYWLAVGNHASMSYMENYRDIRLDPRLLMPEAKSIVCVAMNYMQPERIAPSEYQIAEYAYGKDYHVVMRDRLHQLANTIGAGQYRVCCDTAPIMERYWAAKSGLGWIGHNRQLIIPGAGTHFFLGEILVDIELDYDVPLPYDCKNCHRCIDACPTGALSGEFFDARKCISYHTIENRGVIPVNISRQLGKSIYGCDRCQQACPHNQKCISTKEPAFSPSEELLNMTKEKWQALSIEDYHRLFKGSAVKRVKYEGLMRNIKLVSNNDDQS